MSNYREMTKRLYIWLIVILLVFVVLAFILPEQHLFSGIALGLTISLYNFWLLQRKTRLQGEAAAREGKRTSTGMIPRFAAAALGALIAMEFHWSIVGYVIGLMTVYPVIMIDFIWHHQK